MKIMKNGVLVEVIPTVDPAEARLKLERKRRAALLGSPTPLRPAERERVEAARLPNGHFAPGQSGFPGGSVRKAREDRYFIDAMKATFELMGGVPTMLEWANEHKTEFYRLMGKLIPVQVNIEREYGSNTFTIHHALPPPPGNKPIPEGMVIELVNPKDMTQEQINKAIQSLDADARQELFTAIAATLPVTHA